jgi:hypothetical protein
MPTYKLQARISPELNVQFRELIQKKYKKYEKGLLSYEVEMALRSWVAQHTNAQEDLLSTVSSKTKPNPTPKVMVAFNQVKEYLITTRHFYTLMTGQQIPTKFLEEAIANTRGSDPRTVQKWLRTFHKNGCIKPVTAATWEIM